MRFQFSSRSDEPCAFEVSNIASGPGDVFVIFTDGMTEIVDGKDRDLGLEPLKSVLVENASAPLSPNSPTV